MERWILSQQIAQLAHCLREYAWRIHNCRDEVNESDPAQVERQRLRLTRVRNDVRLKLEDLLDVYGWNEPALRTMPPASLYLLRQLGQGNLTRRFAPLTSRIGNVLRTTIEGNGSVFSRAQDFAHHLLHAPGASDRLLRLGDELFPIAFGPQSRSRWRQLQESSESRGTFADLVQSLRDRRLRTDARLRVITEIAELLDCEPHDPAEAAQLENNLLQQALAWPLLVVPFGLVESGFSLPVGVDVDLAERQPTHLQRESDRCAVIGGSRLHIDAVGGEMHPRDQRAQQVWTWRRYLGLAARVGRRLWLGSHGHHGPIRAQVRASTVVYDLRVADQVVAPLVDALGETKLRLEDGSAAPYLAQVVLSRLLGKRWQHPSAVTSFVGQAVRTSRGRYLRDYKNIPAGGIVQKLQHVCDTRVTERLVVADDEASTSRAEEFLAREEEASTDWRAKRFMQAVEVVRAAQQSNVADAFQPEGWRKWVMIRHPEVAEAVHSPGRKGLLPIEHEHVQSVFRALAESVTPVLEMRGVSPTAVASALWHVNNTVIPAIAPWTPPGLSWSFVRLVQEELDNRFWQLLWRLIGAPEIDFERFRHAPTTLKAAEELERVLNHFEPDVHDRPSHRAPDFIVLTGSALLDLDYATIADTNPTHRPVAVKPILDQLAARGRLQLSRARYQYLKLRKLLGPVRIICLPDEEHLDSLSDAFSIEELDPQTIAKLRPLSVFRWGFRQQMAAALLHRCGPAGLMVRHTLDELQRRGLLRKSGAEYYLPRQLKRELEASTSASDAAEYHHAAALASAPYANASAVSGLSYDVAALHEYVTEAKYHAKVAFRLLDTNQKRGIHQIPAAGRPDRPDGWVLTKNAVQPVLQRLARFSAVPSWGAVTDLIQGKSPGRHAYVMAIELIRAGRQFWGPAYHRQLHPVHMLTTARALLAWGTAKDHRVVTWFQRAEAACSREPNERSFNLLQVLPYFANYQFSRGRWEEARRLDRQVELLRPQWKYLPGEWFERIGDHESDDRSAEASYTSGIIYSPKWQQLPFKALGAAVLAGSELSEPVRRWLQQDDQAIINCAVKALNSFRRDARIFARASRGESHAAEVTAPKNRTSAKVMERWEAAIDELSKRNASSTLMPVLAMFVQDSVDSDPAIRTDG